MTTAKDLMSAGVRYIPATETLDRAAQLMREHNIGALPVCDTDGNLAGIITDRDIVTLCVAAGHDPAKITAGDIMTETPGWAEPTAASREVISQMASLRVRRLPVIDGGKLVGMITEADIVRKLPQSDIYTFVQGVYSDLSRR
jgi:CBS domain-containing protein